MFGTSETAKMKRMVEWEHENMFSLNIRYDFQQGLAEITFHLALLK